MANMMRSGKNNPSCKCCNDDVCDGFRTREKREWASDVERQINEMQTIDPIIFKVSTAEWEQLDKALNEPTPPSVSEGLKRLFGKNE